MIKPLAPIRRALHVQGLHLEVAALVRDGDRDPVVFLHGFGSTKEDYADVALHDMFDGSPILAYDAPGRGESICFDLSRVDIPLLVETALAMINAQGFERFHLVGHSMGGLTALLLADRHPERVLSFTDIEGNLAAEDCFLSRQIDDYPADDAERFFDDFIARTRQAPAYASALYAASLRHKVRAGAVRSIFRSMVDLSDHGGLMQRFLALQLPRMFMYGDQNATLSYLRQIEQQGVRLAPIERCGHFPMYSNPLAMWAALAAFHAST